MAENGDMSVDGLLREFLLETRDTLDAVEAYGTALSEAPADADAQKRLQELVHSVKGACGFLPLPRLEAVAAAVTEAADTLAEDGQVPASSAMESILAAVGRMRDILDVVDREGTEPPGAAADAELIAALVAITRGGSPAAGDTGGEAETDADVSVEADLAAAALLEIAADEQASGLYVIFRAGDGGSMALDAAHVVWLDVVDEVPAADGGGEALIRGETVPLRGADGGPVGGLAELKPVIVVTDGERRVGVVVDEIIDVAADPDARAGEPVAIIGPERFLEN